LERWKEGNAEKRSLSREKRGVARHYLRNLVPFWKPADDTQHWRGRQARKRPRQGTHTMPDKRKFGSPATRNRIAEWVIVGLVLLAAAVAYWWLR